MMNSLSDPPRATAPAALRLASDSPPRRPATAHITACARRAYALNGRRAALMGRGLFGDPAWDILLDLFLSECDAQPLCVTSVCIGSRSSPATALRYIGLLLGRGLIDRVPDTVDRRRTFVRLTDRGWNAMLALLDGEAVGQTQTSGDDHRAVS